MKKNEEYEVVITDTAVGGEGIGKVDGITLFVKDAVIGDRARVKITKMKKRYGYARLMDLLEPSPWRAEPKCRCYRQCGGCQLQALKYEKQLEFKQKKVDEDLRRIGGFGEVCAEPIIGMENPWQYRNKAQFPVGRDAEGYPAAGFYAARSHRIVPNRDCPIGLPVNRKVLDAVLSVMEETGVEPYEEETGTGCIRHILIRCGIHTGEVMVCLVINAEELPHAERFVEALSALQGMKSISVNINRQRTNVILGETVRTLWGQPFITDSIGGISFRISPLSFYQVNTVQTEKLYELVSEYAGLTGSETVWDLYCGIGTISLFLAGKARKVFGVEVVHQAVADARENAVRNGIANAEFLEGKAEEVLPLLWERSRQEGRPFDADVVVVDPPRKGCGEELLQTMLQIRPARIVYVSCDPATLARDLKVLCAGGYELRRVRPVDQFCQTVHVETAALLIRERSQKQV